MRALINQSHRVARVWPGRSASERNESRSELASVHRQLEHRSLRCASAVGRAARVENPDTIMAVDLRPMRVAVDDGGAAWEARHQARLPPHGRAGDVRHSNANAVGVDREFLRQDLEELSLVDVAEDRLYSRAERTEFLQRSRRGMITGVQDQIGRGQAPNALLRQSARTAGKVRVGDNGHLHRGQPFTKSWTWW